MKRATDGDERELISSFVERRSEAAFRELYRRYAPGLFQLALRLRGWRRREAEELVQETWLRAARGLERFRFEAGLRTWLTGIALNVSRELERGSATRERGLVPLDGAITVAAADRPGDVRIDLETAIAALPPGYRRVLLLHDVEGYTHREIGELLAIDAGTSKSQLAHARRRLRQILRGGRGTPEPKAERKSP